MRARSGGGGYVIQERGWRALVGGKPNSLNILREFDSLLSYLQRYDKFKALTPLSQFHFKDKITVLHEKLCSCFGQDNSNN